MLAFPTQHGCTPPSARDSLALARPPAYPPCTLAPLKETQRESVPVAWHPSTTKKRFYFRFLTSLGEVLKKYFTIKKRGIPKKRRLKKCRPLTTWPLWVNHQGCTIPIDVLSLACICPPPPLPFPRFYFPLTFRNSKFHVDFIILKIWTFKVDFIILKRKISY